ncbi:MAG: hypothetical protein ACK4I0_09205 [Brevundimonas sp.]|uniref:hypothetical protein n=1 Tax=Brevundimonas sp. TaxID=1871086 RepID=UPI00391C8861
MQPELHCAAAVSATAITAKKPNIAGSQVLIRTRMGSNSRIETSQPRCKSRAAIRALKGKSLAFSLSAAIQAGFRPAA